MTTAKDYVEQLSDAVERIGHNTNELRACLKDPDDDPLLPLIQRMEEVVLEALNAASGLRELLLRP